MTCTDVVPSGGNTCAQHRDWGSCSADWMLTGGYCAKTCGACGTVVLTNVNATAGGTAVKGGGGSAGGCTDLAPSGGASCVQQKGWGKCGERWMKDGWRVGRAASIILGIWAPLPTTHTKKQCKTRKNLIDTKREKGRGSRGVVANGGNGFRG